MHPQPRILRAGQVKRLMTKTQIDIQVPPHISAVGRVLDWLKDPHSRFPVSCTVLAVQDSMEGEDGIEESWLFASKALRNAAGVTIDLSQLRAKGADNGHGLVSSGPVSFAQIYSKFNEILRRGGTYKNGAITVYLDADHPDAEEFLLTPRKELPWVKRALYVDNTLMNNPLLPLIIRKMGEGDLWLAKKQWDTQGNRLYSNVCMEILIQSRGTCLISHVNLGSCPIDEIPQAFVTGMEFLCNLHAQSGVGGSGIYLPPELDKQVGLGVLGLANLLAIEGVSYADFVDALEAVVTVLEVGECDRPVRPSALYIARQIADGYKFAADVARRHQMGRAFTIAPTASCSYRYRDRERFTTAPEISPPNCNPRTKEVDRDSGTFGVVRYEYHPATETAASVPWDVQYRLMKAWQRLMDTTGLAHAISFNIWDKCPIDEAFIKDWLESPLKTTYYRLVTQQDALDKSSVWAQCTEEVCTTCAE